MWQYISIFSFIYIMLELYWSIKAFDQDKLEYDKYYNE